MVNFHHGRLSISEIALLNNFRNKTIHKIVLNDIFCNVKKQKVSTGFLPAGQTGQGLWVILIIIFLFFRRALIYVIMPNKCGIVNCRGNYDLLSKRRIFKLPRLDPERQRWLAVIPPRKDFNVANAKSFFYLWEALATKSSNEETARWNNKTSCCT